MDYSIKDELHQLIDKCEEEAVLYEIKERLTHSEEDWWDTDFTKEEQEEMLEDTRQVDAGNYVTNEEVMKKFDKWLKK